LRPRPAVLTGSVSETLLLTGTPWAKLAREG